MKKFALSCIIIVITLVSYGQPMFLEEPEAFKIACQGDLAKLDSLLKANNNIGIENPMGGTLLHKAIGCGQEEIVKYLIDKGIDINKKDNSGSTPLLVAISANNATLVSLLKEKKAQVDFNIIYPDGLSPLEKAILFGGLDYVKPLVENGADVNTVNTRGSTPLRIAMRDGFEDIADYLISKGADIEKATMPPLKGAYLGQEKPGLTPKLFAPGIVSIEHGNINAAFHPNGQEIYFTVESPHYNRGTIMVTKMKGDVWTKSEPLEVVGNYTSWEPYISPDGMKLFYASKRPVNLGDSINESMDLWVLNREGDHWTGPVHLGNEVNSTDDEVHPSVATNGDLYFSNKGIRVSKCSGHEIQESIPWTDPGDTLNWNADPFIAPDGSYLMFTSYRPGGYGEGDIYISFRNDDGSWKPAKNMGEVINSSANEFPSGLTPDGRYFIFASSRLGFFMPDIYWVNAQIIENMR